MANDEISLAVEPGQIHALLGENGAGKTTLMNVLYGLTQPDEGEILVDGEPVTLRSPKDAIAAGIGMVHQHFMLVPVFTVAENVTLGAEQTRRLGLLDRRRTRREVARAVRAATGSRSTRTPWSRTCRSGCSSGSRSSRRWCARPTCSILDEPTAVLTPGETEELFRIMRQLKAGGTVDHLHLAQAQGSPGDRRHDHRHPAGQGGRPAAADGHATTELAALMVGRQVQLRVEQGRRPSRARWCSTSAT